MGECIPFDYRTASGVIHNKKCLLYGLIVTPDGTNNSYADIYDGVNTSEPQVMRVRVVSTTSRAINFGRGVLLQRGLYIDFETNLSSVTVFSKVVK